MTTDEYACCINCPASLICLSQEAPSVGYYIRSDFCLMTYGRYQDFNVIVPSACPRAWSRGREQKNWKHSKLRWLRDGATR